MINVYYLNYRTHEQRWEIPECWAFREQFEAEQYEKQGGEVPPTGNNEYSEYGQEYAEYDQQQYDEYDQQQYDEYDQQQYDEYGQQPYDEYGQGDYAEYDQQGYDYNQ